jgi:nicotinate-nucleotide adenylyltransferase
LRVGILGGVFNPPHIGHLVCAQEALVRLRLDRVVLVPVGEAPHREVEDDPGAGARLEMCELAAGAAEWLAVSRIELDRPGPSFTADTLAELRIRRPEEDVVLILGGDEVAALPSWHEPERVLELATVAGVERQGGARRDILERISALRGSESVEFFDMPRVDVSSSLVRRRVAEGLPIRYLVPDAVADHIALRGLYRAPARAGTR